MKSELSSDSEILDRLRSGLASTGVSRGRTLDGRTTSPNIDPDESLQQAATDDNLRRFKDVQYAHTQNILEGMISDVHDVDGEKRIEFNEEAAEMARRVWAEATGEDVSPFYGATHSAANLRKFAAEATKCSDHYETKGYSTSQVVTLRKMAKQAFARRNQARLLGRKSSR